MNKYSLLFIKLIFALSVSAQDTIVRVNGDLIIAKIIEINPTEIKYKKFKMPDSPLYIELKSSIKMIKYVNGVHEEFDKQQSNSSNNTSSINQRTVDYYGETVQPLPSGKISQNGKKFTLNNKPISERQLLKILIDTKDNEISSLAMQSLQAKQFQYIGFATMPLGMIALISFLQSLPVQDKAGNVSTNPNAGSLRAVAGICFVGAIACPIVSGINGHKRRIFREQSIKLYNEKY